MPPWLMILLAILGFLLSVAAFIVSLLAFKRAGPLTTLQTRIATLELAGRKRAEASLARADVRVALHETGPYAHRLVIDNRGPGTAFNVDLSFKDPDHDNIFPQGVRKENLPIAELGAGEHVSMVAALVMERYPPFDATLIWTDPDGTEQRKETKVRVS